MAEKTTFADALKSWQDAYREFCEAVQQIPVEQQKTPGICGEWSSKELIAHLAGWQREALKRYRDYQAGDTSSKRYDFDAFNAASVEALSLLNWREVFETLQYTYDDLLTAVKALTPAQIAEDSRYQAWLDGLGTDFVEHAEQVRGWLSAPKDDSR